MRTTCLHHMVLVCLLALPLQADFAVNVRTSGSQASPAVAMDPGGRSVVVWSSYFTSPGRSNEIIARRIGPMGGPVGDEFQVNAAGEGNQTACAVAMDGRGDFIVVWQGPGRDEEDIFGRKFARSGETGGDELLLNAYTPGRQLCPRVSMNAAGRFVVAWESRETVDDVDRTCVCAQLFDPNGAAVGAEIVADDGLYNCRHPDVAMSGAGNFVVTWMQQRSSNTIMARLFDANALAATEPFAVSTTGLASLTRPSIAMNSSGYFVVTWDGDPNRASADDIHARLYDPNGAPRTDPFVVNTITVGAQQWPRAAMNDASEFLIVWEHETEDPNIATDIFARRFDTQGAPLGEEVRLNTCVLGRQRHADVAMAGDGSFLAVWESDEQDGSDSGIFAHTAEPTALADFNADGLVDLADFARFALLWRHEDNVGATDLTRDGIVRASDMAMLSRQWLRELMIDY